MNFFDRQAHLRRLSVRLVLLFLAAVAGIIVVVDLAVAFAMGAFSNADPGQLLGTLGFTSVAVAAVDVSSRPASESVRMSLPVFRVFRAW